jgi:hypothetical protein
MPAESGLLSGLQSSEADTLAMLSARLAMTSTTHSPAPPPAKPWTICRSRQSPEAANAVRSTARDS